MLIKFCRVIWPSCSARVRDHAWQIAAVPIERGSSLEPELWLPITSPGESEQKRSLKVSLMPHLTLSGSGGGIRISRLRIGKGINAPTADVAPRSHARRCK